MDTLVLDVGYRPIARIPWERAVTLLWEKKVEIVETYDTPLRSMVWSIMKPAVIRFLRSMTGRKRTIKFSRESVWLRDQGKCQYCGIHVSREDFTYDHVTPRILGGITTWQNIVVSCVPCNAKKGGRTPAQAGMRLLSVPVHPKKLPHGSKQTLFWREGMPESWRTWLRDQVVSHQYWHGEIDAA